MKHDDRGLSIFVAGIAQTRLIIVAIITIVLLLTSPCYFGNSMGLIVWTNLIIALFDLNKFMIKRSAAE